MPSSGGPGRPDPGPARTVEIATDAAWLLLSLTPVLGEQRMQQAVDLFVERAAEALRALDAGRLPSGGAGQLPSSSAPR